MTLKAKVEAVVYAAEEPVTLAQLAVIFANEVLQELAAEEEEIRQSAGEDAAEPQLASAEPALWEELFPPGASQVAAPSEGGSPAGTDENKAARRRAARVRDRLQLILDELISGYAEGQRGMEIREIAGGYRMTTKPEYHDAVRGFVKSLKPPMKLSLQALETLAVVAYKQPVTAPEVSEIRGVDSGGVLGSLLGRKLVATAGRKHVIGRPILYKTTKEFLLRFGLRDLNELPSMEEFEKMAGELAQAEAEAEDAAMRSSDLPQGSPELPQWLAEPVMPIAGSDTGEAEAAYGPDDQPDDNNMTSLNIGPSPLPEAAEQSSINGQRSAEGQAENEIESKEQK